MAGDRSGNDDATDDRWNERSATEPDVRTTTDSSETDSSDAERDRIPLDLSGSDADDGSADDETSEADEYAPEASSTPIEAGDPDLENALFVALGAIAMVLVLVRLVGISL
ncbi:DUF7312 domain-containing protein [Natrinema salsiterrestre]|uniref:DUF7312 domain-containing protein n=1 Tax=Natrinema salsiterrestre TaxID=2950540 RepID=A0A9Q4L3B5_9EURY|nr:hypothetical protein [Natrinema salsiterrestre]MDF9745737.1 hypothetical protein [Natrinema salsiterrestre]